MKKETGRKIIEQRVEDFEKNALVLKKKGHGETNIRSNYIDVFFEALGWNMKSHYEVVREFSQKDNSGTKKVDYAFKINGKLKFFVEAKEASIDLVNDKSSIYQSKRYAYSTNGKAPIVILTDFEEFRVFNVLKAPDFNNTDRELLKKHCFDYTGYLDNWDLLWDTFSKEAVAAGSIEALRGKIDKNTKTMDVDFLEQITGWREDLARNIAIRNKELAVDELNEAVQRILDRLLFIRNLEDREIEPENSLLDKTKKTENIYKSIIPLFNSLDNVYNGLLFKKHFSEELIVDDKTIKDIIKNMCYPVSPFQFDVIEPEILGRIYEKFLGSKIRLTENHQAKIEEKIEVRKAGGVYYTPEYIVNYIVENTVGKKIEGLNPEEIKKIKIVDPACGSGSFLLGAYSYLLDYHAKWYAKNKSDKAYKKDYYITKDGELKVNLDKRGSILRDNIFGVDIDKEATEVAIMSLYLKMLDDGFDKGERDLFFIKGHVLPDMTDNIKCGNSLIGLDIYDGKFEISRDEEKNLNPFDWNNEFSLVFINGGFDCVIGNPPYVFGRDWKALGISDLQKDYLGNKYKSSPYQLDMFSIFMEKSYLLGNTESYIGQIVPNVWLTNTYSKTTRNFILSHSKNLIITTVPKNVFPGITVDTIVYTMQKGSPTEFFKISSIEENTYKEKFDLPVKQFINGDQPISTSLGQNGYDLLCKIQLDNVPLSDLAEITRGVHPYRVGGYGRSAFSNGAQIQKDVELRPYNSKEKLDDYRPFIYGKDLKRYTPTIETEYIKYGPWLAEPRQPEFFEGDRIYSRKILGERLVLTVETKNSIADQQVYITKPKSDNTSSRYLAGILGSKLMAYFIRNFYDEGSDAFPQIKVSQLKSLPIKIADKDTEEKITTNIELIIRSNEIISKMITDHEKQQILRKISYLESLVDDLVYKLYGLTDEEIRIVEGN
jgi:type I restriction-modification system DNA methylase subunit